MVTVSPSLSRFPSPSYSLSLHVFLWKKNKCSNLKNIQTKNETDEVVQGTLEVPNDRRHCLKNLFTAVEYIRITLGTPDILGTEVKVH